MVVFHFLVNITLAGDTPSPTALLHGVEFARNQFSVFSAKLEIHFHKPPPDKALDCLVDLDGTKRRFEIIGDGSTVGEVIIRDDDEFHSYRRKRYADVCIYGLNEAAGERGDIAFDPRILGLDDVMPCNLSVKECLPYNSQELALVGQETMQGVRVWHVKAVRDETTFHFWIEEPSFRVYKKTMEWPGSRVEINSEFTDDSIPSAIPSRVTTVRTTEGLATSEREFVLKGFEAGQKIDPTQFTIGSMKLPLNTAFVDYRIHRIVGYWNGEGLTEHPLQQFDPPSKTSVASGLGSWHFYLVVLNILVVLALGMMLWIRKRRYTITAKSL